MTIGSAIYITLLLCGITLLVVYTRIGKLLRCCLFTAATGLFSLAVLWILSAFTPLGIIPTPLSVLVSGILGIPGVITMLIFNLL